MWWCFEFVSLLAAGCFHFVRLLPVPTLVLLAVVGRIKLLTVERPVVVVVGAVVSRAVIFAAAVFSLLEEDSNDDDECRPMVGCTDDDIWRLDAADGSRRPLVEPPMPRSADIDVDDDEEAAVTNGLRATVAPMLEPLELLRLGGIRECVAPPALATLLGDAGAEAEIMAAEAAAAPYGVRCGAVVGVVVLLLLLPKTELNGRLL